MTTARLRPGDDDDDNDDAVTTSLMSLSLSHQHKAELIRSSHEVVLLEIQLKYRVFDGSKDKTDVLGVCRHTNATHNTQ